MITHSCSAACPYRTSQNVQKELQHKYIRLRTLFLLEVGVAQQFVRCTAPQSVWVVQLVVFPDMVPGHASA